MKKSLVLATLMAAVALAACGKKEEAAPAPAPAPVAAPAPAPADRLLRPLPAPPPTRRPAPLLLLPLRRPPAPPVLLPPPLRPLPPRAPAPPSKRILSVSARSRLRAAFALLERVSLPARGVAASRRGRSGVEPGAAGRAVGHVDLQAVAQRVRQRRAHEVGPVVLLAQVRGHHLPQAARAGSPRAMAAAASLARWPQSPPTRLLQERRIADRCRASSRVVVAFEQQRRAAGQVVQHVRRGVAQVGEHAQA